MSIKFVTITLGFVVTRLLSEYLSVYDYGTYSQAMLIVSTVNTITILGMIDGVNYFYCSEHNIERRESYIATIFTFQCIVSTVAGLLVLILSAPICGYFENPDLKRLLIFSATLPLFINLLSMMQVLVVSIGKAKMIAIRNLLVSVIRLAIVVVVVLSVPGVEIVMLTTLILDVLQVFIFAGVLRKNHCPILWKRIDFSLWKRIVAYCIPMGVFTAISALNRDMDKYMISLVTDTETLAIYANASKILPFDIIMSSFCTVLIPQITRQIANGEKERAAEMYRLFLEISYMTTAILCCAALAASPQLMKLLYSNKYEAGLGVFRIYILVDLLRFTNMTLVLSAAGKTKKLMMLSIGSLAMNAIMNILLYYIFGIEGPAIATLLTTVALGTCILWSGARELDTYIWNLFDVKRLLLFGMESLALTWILHKLQQKLDQMDVHYFVILIMICGIYGLTMVLLNGRRLLRALKKVNARTSA